MMGFRLQAALVVGMGAVLIAPWVASQPVATRLSEAVYRCPGPPVVYTDAISPDEAKARGCAVLSKAEDSRSGRSKPSACPAGLARCDAGLSSPVGPPVGASGANWAALDLYMATPASAPAPAKLGPLDTWRYRRCQENAAQAPTSVGVHQGMRLCREQFGQ